MIDRLICAKARDCFYDDYSSSEALKDTRLHNPKTDRLAVIFPPWHGGGSLIQKLTDRLTAKRWAVLEFELHDQILEPNADRVLKSYDSVRHYAGKDIGSVQKEHGYEQTKLIGISLGTLAMSLVAEEAEFTSADFVIPCSQLAAAMWEGARTQGVRTVLEAKGYNRSMLVDRWRELEPQAYAASFKDKDVHNILAPSDKIINYSYQKEMVDQLQSNGARTVNSYSRLGHAATIARHSFRGKI